MNRQIGKTKRFARDENAGIESLPLQLLIMVVIAVIALAVMLSWINTEADLKSIDVETDPGTLTTQGGAITVTAWDSNGNPLEGADVRLEGAGIVEIAKTDADGKATFSVQPELPKGTNFGEISVTASYTGQMTMTKNAQVIVKSA